MLKKQFEYTKDPVAFILPLPLIHVAHFIIKISKMRQIKMTPFHFARTRAFLLVLLTIDKNLVALV